MESSTDLKNDISNSESPLVQLEEYVESLKVKAEKLIFDKFPEKIVELNTIIDASNFEKRSLKEVHEELNIPAAEPNLLNNDENLPPPKKIKYDTNVEVPKKEEDVAASPINKRILALLETLKPYITNLSEDLNLLKMWISLMIPKIEGGNNFGVSVQAAVLAEIRSIEVGTATFFDNISEYYVSRGKLMSRARKYPHVDDHKQAVKETDESTYFSLWLILIEIRNYYCSLHDVVTKNFDKIKKPRATNASESFY